MVGFGLGLGTSKSFIANCQYRGSLQGFTAVASYGYTTLIICIFSPYKHLADTARHCRSRTTFWGEVMRRRRGAQC